MSTQCKFNFLKNKAVEVRFNEGPITTDAGLSVLIEWMRNESFIQPFANFLAETDSRREERIEHSMSDLLRQRVLQIIAGYEDANDSDELREDPVFKAANDRAGKEGNNASQPTISRLENAVNARDVVGLNRKLLTEYIQARLEAPDQITLEIDGTPASVHGNQQRAMFDGYRNQKQYHPLVVADSETGELLAVRLREGTAHDKHRAYPQLKRVLEMLTEAFPETKLKFRADNGFTDPRIYRLLDKYNVQWTINFSMNEVLKRKTEDILEGVCKKYEKTHAKVTRYILLEGYQANSWEKTRPVVAKVECGPQGTNRRFVVCSERPDEAVDSFDFYEGRGVCEQYIREFKGGYRGDKMSCESFVANAFRLVVTAIAFTAVARFRKRHLVDTELEGSFIETIRRKLFKLGARIKVTCRRMWIYASESWPYQKLFRRVAESVSPQPG